MPKMNISRSIEIDAPASSIFPKLNDFNEWIPWSPWLLMEPEAKVTVAEDMKYYEWEGSRVGSGNMKVLEEVENTFIDYDLNFLKPWKSHAKTSFRLEELGGKTKVTWLMDSSLPFFMFWMKKMMEAYVGADYERGLDMLKAYVEQGEVPSKLEFMGNRSCNALSYIGIKTVCDLSVIDKQMEADFGKLDKYLNEKGLEALNVLSIYHKWDMVGNKVHYTAAMAVSEKPADLSTEFVSGQIPKTDAYVLKHTGPYEHVGNAWSTLYAMQRNKEFKINKKTDPFEIYLNDPAETDKKELITEVHFPVI